MADTTKPLLRDREIQKLIAALRRSGQPFTEKEAQCVMEWAMRIRIEEALLAVVLKGQFALVFKDGAVHLLDNKEQP